MMTVTKKELQALRAIQIKCHEYLMNHGECDGCVCHIGPLNRCVFDYDSDDGGTYPGEWFLGDLEENIEKADIYHK